MMSRTQITLEPEMQRRALWRASELGISLAKYVRRPVADDLGVIQAAADRSGVFDLGSSGGSDIAKEKRVMTAQAFAGIPPKQRRR